MLETLGRLERRLEAIEQTVTVVRELAASKRVVKEFYTTAEVAGLLGRRPYTVREWCRLGRVHAIKAHAGRGSEEEWRISHEDLLRIKNEGLLPVGGHGEKGFRRFWDGRG